MRRLHGVEVALDALGWTQRSRSERRSACPARSELLQDRGRVFRRALDRARQVLGAEEGRARAPQGRLGEPRRRVEALLLPRQLLDHEALEALEAVACSPRGSRRRRASSSGEARRRTKRSPGAHTTGSSRRICTSAFGARARAPAGRAAPPRPADRPCPVCKRTGMRFSIGCSSDGERARAARRPCARAGRSPASRPRGRACTLARGRRRSG